MRNIYFTDGTPAGFFTAVFDGYLDKAAYITSSHALQFELGDIVKNVQPETDKTARVLKKLRAIDKQSIFEIDFILRTPCPEREQIAFEYLKTIVKTRAPVRERLHLSEVRRALDLVHKVTGERHRLTGFLRFTETANGVFYAPCSPDNDVVDLLMPHFTARFKTSPFIIHDVKRKLAGIYNGKEWLVSPLGENNEAEILPSDREDKFLGLWIKYYRSVYIPARKNTKLMKGYMPVRYWKFMPEKQVSEDDPTQP